MIAAQTFTCPMSSNAVAFTDDKLAKTEHTNPKEKQTKQRHFISQVWVITSNKLCTVSTGKQKLTGTFDDIPRGDMMCTGSVDCLWNVHYHNFLFSELLWNLKTSGVNKIVVKKRCSKINSKFICRIFLN